MSSEPTVDPKKVRDMKIKTGIVKRLAKEKVSYEKESDKIQEKINKMKTNSEDDFYIKKQEQLLEESQKMIPDCERRLKSAWEELSKCVEAERDLSETEEYKAALVVLEEAKASSIPS